MATRNGVTRAATSKAAEKCAVAVMPDCRTAASGIPHLIAPRAVQARVRLVASGEAL